MSEADGHPTPGLETAGGFDGFFAAAVHRTLAAMEHGTLVVREGGVARTYGTGAPRVTVVVHHPRFYRRLSLGGTVGAAESYMEGDWDCDQLTSLMRIMLANREAMSPLDGLSTGFVRTINRLRHVARRNHRAGSRRNVRAHYDLSNAFFETFLDEHMMYSSAVYESPDATLEEASVAKLERLCRKLELTGHDHLLEIGSGWGGLAVYAASRFGCRVTTVTVSPAQHQAAIARVERAGLAGRVEVRLCDYRDLDGHYDKLVSVEMVEAVGDEYLDGYFSALHNLLRPGGLMAIQAITIRDHRYQEAIAHVDFIKKHVFPGTFIPCVSRLVEAAARTGDSVLVSLEDIGLDYAATLAEWRRRAEANRDRILALGFDERFLRMWRYYLCYCEGGFRERTISDVQLLFAQPAYRGRPWRAGLDGAAEGGGDRDAGGEP